MSALHKAARENNVDEMQQMIVSGKYDINEKDGLKRTPLHLACWAGHFDMVKLLLRSRAKIDALANDNFTCLHFTSKPEIARELVKRDKHLLVARVSKGNKTALHMAIQKGNADLVNCLLELGADVTAKTSTNQTCMDLAKNDEIYALLRAKLEERVHNQQHAAKKSQDNDDSHADEHEGSRMGNDVQDQGSVIPPSNGSTISNQRPTAASELSSCLVVVDGIESAVHNAEAESILGARTADIAGLDPRAAGDKRSADGSFEKEKDILEIPSKKARVYKPAGIKLSHLEQDDDN